MIEKVDQKSLKLNFFFLRKTDKEKEFINFMKLIAFLFLKHFFYINTPEGQQIFGYNKSKIQWLGGPGFFTLRKNEENGDLLVDYGPDFKKLIPKEEFSSWRGRRVNKIKNNKRNVVYGGGLIDYLHTINDSMVIGKGIIKTKIMKKTKTMGYFILIKK